MTKVQVQSGLLESFVPGDLCLSMKTIHQELKKKCHGSVFRGEDV
jgi:hypothetical protein